MAKDVICLDKVSVQRLLTEAIATGEHDALIRVVASLGDEMRPVVTLSGHEPDAVDRFLAFCADRQLLSDREVIDFSVRMMRMGRGSSRTNICTALEQAVQKRFLS